MQEKEGRKEFLAGPVSTIRIRMTGDWKSKGQLANPGLPGKWLLKRRETVRQIVCAVYTLSFYKQEAQLLLR